MIRVSSCLAVWMALVSVVPAFAQPQRPERPYRGLFGSGVADTSRRLVVNASLSAGYDTNLEAEAVGSTTPVFTASGASQEGVLGLVAGGIAYAVESTGWRFSVSGGTTARYYPSLDSDERMLRASQGSAAFSANLGSRTSVQAGGTLNQQPFSYGSLFPALATPEIGDAAAPANLDLAVTSSDYLSYEVQTGLTHQVGRRVTLGATYGYRRADYGDDRGEFVYHNAATRVTYNVGRGLGLRAGYGYGQAQFAGDAGPVPNQTIDAGVDFNRALSFSRRTTLSFGTGSTATKVRDGSLDYNLTGSARLNHEIGRSWLAFASFARNVIYHETFREPVLTDAASVGIGGLVSRRLQFSVSANAAYGSVGLSADTGSFTSYFGTTTLAYALSRFANVGVAYAYYKHSFDSRVPLPEGALRALDRHSVRATVSLFAPLYTRARRAHATW
jgi:hypothetical protein